MALRTSILGCLIESVRVGNSVRIRIQQPDICRNVKEFLAWRPPGLNSVNFMLLTRLIDRKSLAAVVRWLAGLIGQIWLYLSMGHKSATFINQAGEDCIPLGLSNQTISTFTLAHRADLYFPTALGNLQLADRNAIKLASLSEFLQNNYLSIRMPECLIPAVHEMEK